MLKLKITDKTKKDLKYFFVVSIIITITFELLKCFNQFNLFSLLCGEIITVIINKVKFTIYQGSDKE